MLKLSNTLATCGESGSLESLHAFGMLSSTGIPAPESDGPSLHLQPQTWGHTGLLWMAAEKPGSCWEEALAWACLLPWVPGEKEVKSLRSRAPLGPEHREEMRGRNLGLPEALHESHCVFQTLQVEFVKDLKKFRIGSAPRQVDATPYLLTNTVTKMKGSTEERYKRYHLFLQ